MKSLFLSLIFFSFTVTVSSQVPGYMGKRLSVFYEPNFFLKLQHENHPGINLRNDFAVDYAVSKSVALGGSVKLISTCLYNFSLIDYDNDRKFFGDVRVSGPAFSVYVEKFPFTKRGYLAPVGVYTKWEIVYGKVSGKTVRILSDDNSGYSQVDDIREMVTRKPTVYGFILSFGRQNLFLDRLFINTGGSIGFFPGGVTYVEQGAGYVDFNKSFSVITEGHLLGYFLFNFNVGIGVLAL